MAGAARRRWPEEVRERVRVLHEQGRAPGEIHEAIVSGADGGPPVPVPYNSIYSMLNREPASPPDLRPRALAKRVVTILERELRKLEQRGTRVDLDRLDKIAKTMKAVQPLLEGERPRSGGLQGLAVNGSSGEDEGG
jgi:hypothetical protein